MKNLNMLVDCTYLNFVYMTSKFRITVSPVVAIQMIFNLQLNFNSISSRENKVNIGYIWSLLPVSKYYFPVTTRIIVCGYCDVKVYTVAQMCSTISD
jgi:hypothetical protein